MSRITPLSGFPEWTPAQRMIEQRVVDHLRYLGVDTVELMPIAAFIDDGHLPSLGLTKAAVRARGLARVYEEVRSGS